MQNVAGLFLTCHLVSNESGIGKKVTAQVSALNKSGFEVVLSHLAVDPKNQYSKRLIDDQVLEEYHDSFLIKKKWKWRFSFNAISQYIADKKIKFLYIRYTHFSNYYFINFLKKAKSLGVIIFLEIPTYPYDDEYRDARGVLKASLYVEKSSRQDFKSYVDRIVTYSDDKTVFGVPTIELNNGVDLSETPIRNVASNKSAFSIIAVSSMEYWHGYDRLLNGLRAYLDENPKANISLNFAGGLNTQTAKEYIDQSSRLGLKEHVKFLGYVSGPELDHLFDYADIAIGVLGGHRKSLNAFKSLKNREYCARGLPFIYSGRDSTFDNKDFAMEVPSDDSAIDVASLIKWRAASKEPAKEMREFAENNISWDTQMQIVQAEYLKLR